MTETVFWREIMLDERRVRRMAKLASYESKEGKEDIEISMYFRKDYVSVNVLKTMLWVTVGYVIAAVLVLLGSLESLMESVTIGMIVALLAGVIVGYIAVMAGFFFGAKKFYWKKHEAARERVKRYCHDLIMLEKWMEKENEE